MLLKFIWLPLLVPITPTGFDTTIDTLIKVCVTRRVFDFVSFETIILSIRNFSGYLCLKETRNSVAILFLVN